MNVGDIMTREVHTIGPDTPIREIARLLYEHGLTGVPVVDSEGRPLGIVTEADLVVRNAHVHFPRFIQILDARIYLPGQPKHFEEEMRRVLGTTAKDVMTAPARVIAPEAPIEDLATLMVEEKVNPVPVVRNGVVVGIVSRSDLMGLLVRDYEADQA